MLLRVVGGGDGVGWALSLRVWTPVQTNKREKSRNKSVENMNPKNKAAYEGRGLNHKEDMPRLYDGSVIHEVYGNQVTNKGSSITKVK